MSLNPTSTSLIDQSVVARRQDLARAFREARPFRHVVIDSFFDPTTCQRMLAEFPRFEDRFALNEMGKVGGKAVQTHVRDISGAYRAVDDFIQRPEFLRFMSEITGIPNLLYDPDYVGGGTHENRDGQGLDPHVDFNYHPRNKQHRRLNLIVYLNPEWQESWGGALELQSNPWDEKNNTTKRVLPLLNRAVVFETNEISWHGFSTIKLPADRKNISRKSFAIYLYTCERPAAETAPSHATVYVPDTRPAEVQAGVALTATHVHSLDQRFRQLRDQLKFLYDREKEFTLHIAELEHALVDARRAQRLPLQGYATQPDATTGIWPDQWCGSRLEFTLQAARPVGGLDLAIFVLKELGGEQTLTINVGTTTSEERLAAGKRHDIRVACRLAAGATAHIVIQAARTWTPSSSGASADGRPLAFRLESAVLDHA